MKEKFNKYFYFLFINIFAFTNSVFAIEPAGVDATGGTESVSTSYVEVTRTCADLKKYTNFIEILNKIWSYMIIIGPLVFIVSGLMDFMKAVSSSDEKAFGTLIRKIVKKFIALLILLILPVIINFVLGLLNPDLGVCLS